MKKFAVLTLALVVGGTVLAQEAGRVLSVTPVIQPVAVQRQVCSNQAVVVAPPRSGAGAALGAVVGGAIGNAVGHGPGRAAATMLGLVGGAVVGDQVEGNGPAQVQNVQQCGIQTVYENRVVTYNVVYEYAGRQYTVQMPNDPGPSIALQVSPVGAQQATAYPSAYPAPYPATYVTTAPVVPQVIQAPPTVVVTQPYPSVYPYVLPLSLSLGWLWRGGGHGHWR
jgi:uncharacterized protein YcfJ